MRNKVLILFVLGILGISLWYFIPKGSDKILSQLNIETSDIKEIVTNLDQRIDEPSNIGARITGDKLYLYNNDKEYSLNLPEDSFFVSIAPYINEVHPCTIHNLVTCRGEIYNQSMKVRVVDEDNQIILDEVKVTQENGFIGLWLPKNINATLRVEYDGMFVEYPLSTYSESDTCITTPLKLEPIKF